MVSIAKIMYFIILLLSKHIPMVITTSNLPQNLSRTVVLALRTGTFGEIHYKIRFRVIKILRPGNEEISGFYFLIKYLKSLKTFKNIFKK